MRVERVDVLRLMNGVLEAPHLNHARGDPIPNSRDTRCHQTWMLQYFSRLAISKSVRVSKVCDSSNEGTVKRFG